MQRHNEIKRSIENIFPRIPDPVIVSSSTMESSNTREGERRKTHKDEVDKEDKDTVKDSDKYGNRNTPYSNSLVGDRDRIKDELLSPHRRRRPGHSYYNRHPISPLSRRRPWRQSPQGSWKSSAVWRAPSTDPVGTIRCTAVCSNIL